MIWLTVQEGLKKIPIKGHIEIFQRLLKGLLIIKTFILYGNN
jgi:hypothetical protein